jgi:hypothetical protein
MPHDGVYVRLGISRVHGVGVIAIRDIPEGTEIFGDDDQAVIRVARADVAKFAPALRALYEDFCVVRGAYYLAPPSFNEMTISWFLNHCDEPNVACGAELRFVALRAIAPGEELTADYGTYTEGALPWTQRENISGRVCYADRMATKRGRNKVREVMREYKEGDLKSGGRAKVKSRKQAIAIALSEARREGADIPDRRPAAKKRAAAKKAVKKSAAKKTAARKSTGTKRAAKKAPARKSAARKAPAKKKAAKRSR